MIKEILQSIPGIEIFPIISLVMIMLSFLTLIYLVMRMDKTKVAQYSQLPLEDGDDDRCREGIVRMNREENNG